MSKRPGWHGVVLVARRISTSPATIDSGGCLWAGDPNMDGQLEAFVVGASVRFSAGFSAQPL
jgi:hypothetical protein